ncbi:MAG: TMEM175 family protein [Deltaproteobacteria bacterium]|jgi:uncharacterized membrane protein
MASSAPHEPSPEGAPRERVDPDLSGVEPLRTTRIEALSDGIFAIAMTLLVLGLPVPPPTAGPVALVEALVDLWPRFLGYGTTFLVLGGYWMGQQAQLHFIRRADHVLLWETMLFLSLVAALPFTAALLGEHLEQADALIANLVYCAHLMVTGLVHYATWRHATHERKLVDPSMPRRLIARYAALALGPPVLYAVAMPLALVSGPASLIICALVPIAAVFVPHSLALRAARSRGHAR